MRRRGVLAAQGWRLPERYAHTHTPLRTVSVTQRMPKKLPEQPKAVKTLASKTKCDMHRSIPFATGPKRSMTFLGAKK